MNRPYMKGKFILMVVSLLVILFFVIGCNNKAGSPVMEADWYVDKGATGTGDGQSWDNAFTHPQDAMDAASDGDKIWVAKGVYTSKNPGDSGIPVLTLKGGVEIYGGFDGTETKLSEREYENNVTTLDGGNGTYHVVIGADDARLDGFTITGGNANGSGNDGRGGGMLNYEASPIVVNCVFSLNSAGKGGGMYNYNNSGEVSNCTFEHNHATDTAATNSDGGGGVYDTYSSTDFSHCIFEYNTAEKHGGGFMNVRSSPTITGSSFLSNTADVDGGGMYNNNSSSSSKPTVTNCTFGYNVASGSGGGVYNYHSSAIITECNFKDNEASTHGGGMYNSSSYARITDCVFYSNQASNNGGGIYNYVWDTGSSPVIKNCMIRGNTATSFGGGMYNDDSSPDVLNTTITGNSANYGGGIYNSDSTPTITDSILWGDFVGFLYQEIYDVGTSSSTVSYSDIDQSGYAGSNGNIEQDPLFINGPKGNYYLSQIAAGQASDSPCVDTGSNTAEVLGMTEKTIRTDGVYDTGIVDMGYHYEP